MKIISEKVLLLKRISYTRHAKNRMRWRKISNKDIEKVLISPDKITKINNKYTAHKKLGKRKVKVVFTADNDNIVIITAFDKSN